MKEKEKKTQQTENSVTFLPTKALGYSSKCLCVQILNMLDKNRKKNDTE